jgi:GNAT superfamily N-acetyltransferase
MNTRLGNAADFHALVPVMRKCWLRQQAHDATYRLHPDADERFARWIGSLAQDPRAMMVVSEEQGTIVGFLVATVEKDAPIYLNQEFALVREWWVDPKYRGKGVGQALVDRAAVELARFKVMQLRIRTPERDGESRDALTWLGFRTASRELVLELPTSPAKPRRKQRARNQNISAPNTPM